MADDTRERFFDHLQRELNSERAAALGRAGAKVKDAIDDCQRVRAAMPDPAEPGHEVALAEFRQAYRRYEQARDFFCLHREAVGLLDHRRVDEIYPPPPYL